MFPILYSLLIFSIKLRTIANSFKRCALLISALYTLNLPIAFLVADSDDAPGLIIVASFFVFAPLVIAVFAAVLQHVLTSAIAIKEENDLTV